MALTLISYSARKGQAEIYLIEEPENGLHPLAIQTVHQIISSPPRGIQTLCATHSPIFMAHVRDLEDVIVFKRAPEGFSIARHGSEVPELANWRRKCDVAELFVTGVLS